METTSRNFYHPGTMCGELHETLMLKLLMYHPSPRFSEPNLGLLSLAMNYSISNIAYGKWYMARVAEATG